MVFIPNLFTGFRQDVFKDDINPPQPEPTDYRSMTMADYNIPGFKHVPPAPTKVSAHNLFQLQWENGDSLKRFFYQMLALQEHFCDKLLPLPPFHSLTFHVCCTSYINKTSEMPDSSM